MGNQGEGEKYPEYALPNPTPVAEYSDAAAMWDGSPPFVRFLLLVPLLSFNQEPVTALRSRLFHFPCVFGFVQFDSVCIDAG